MTIIKTTYLGGLRTEAEHMQSGNKIITDAPLDNHGKGEAFSPTDLFATALGSCMLTIMGIAAQTHGFSIDGTQITTEKIMAENPRRVAKLKLEIRLPEGSNYSDKEKKLIEAAANTCPVANSVHPDIVKEISFIW